MDAKETTKELKLMVTNSHYAFNQYVVLIPMKSEINFFQSLY